MNPFTTRTFLVVDDEAFSRAMVSQMLRRLGVAEVIEAADGFEAVNLIDKRREAIDAIITDFRMPGIHGLSLLKQIRMGQTAAERNLVCAMLTGHAERHLVGLAMMLDVDSFLAKPVSIETLAKHFDRCFKYRFEPLHTDDYDRVRVEELKVHMGGTASTKSTATLKPEDDEEMLEEKSAAAVLAQQQVDPKTDRVRAKTQSNAATTRASRSDSGGLPVVPDKPKPTGPAVKVALDDVPADALLARDIRGASGNLLLAAGIPFRANYARRIKELADIEGEITHIWVHA